MNEGVPASRRDRRAWGKRELCRQAKRDVYKIYELSDKGISVPAIARTVSLPAQTVREILGLAEEANDQGGGG